MRKVFIFVIIFLGIVVVLKANDFPYKPKPILLIHGYTSGSRTWGAPTRNRSDSIPIDSVMAHQDETYYHLLQFMKHYAIEWKNIDETYTIPGDDAYPNKAFLEIINFDYSCGSIDPGGKGWPPPDEYQIGWGAELRQSLKEVLEEYYGDGNPNTTSEWADNPEAKVILICHSQGGLDTREALNSVHRSSLFVIR